MGPSPCLCEWPNASSGEFYGPVGNGPRSPVGSTTRGRIEARHPRLPEESLGDVESRERVVDGERECDR